MSFLISRPEQVIALLPRALHEYPGSFYISAAPDSASEKCSMSLQHAPCPAHGFCAQTGPLPKAPLLLHITLHATSLESCSLCVDGLGGLLLVTQDLGPLQPGLMQNLGCFQQQAMPTRKEGSLASAAQPHAELCSGWGRENGTRYEVGRTRRCPRTTLLSLFLGACLPIFPTVAHRSV